MNPTRPPNGNTGSDQNFSSKKASLDFDQPSNETPSSKMSLPSSSNPSARAEVLADEEAPVMPGMNAQFFRVLAWNVSEMRYTHRLTQAELAEKTGLSIDQISQIERGFGRTSFETLIRLADFFAVKVSVLCQDIPKGIQIKAELRRRFAENDDWKFTKEFSESPKVSWIKLSPRKFRQLQVQKNSLYDFIAVEGHVMIEGPEVFEKLKPREVLSLKGSGRVRMRSVSDVPRSEVIVVQCQSDS
jgi:transcriptional regulator with XRE-family HTH domain